MRKEIKRCLDDAKIIVGFDGTIVAVVNEQVLYEENLLDENGRQKYSAFRNIFGRRVPMANNYIVNETKRYVAKPRSFEGVTDKYDESIGLMLVYCQAFLLKSKSAFKRLCGTNEPETFAKNLILLKFGSVEKFLNKIEPLIIRQAKPKKN